LWGRREWMLVMKRTSTILERLPTLFERVNEGFPWCTGDQVILLVHVYGMELQLGCIPPELIQVVRFSWFWFSGVKYDGYVSVYVFQCHLIGLSKLDVSEVLFQCGFGEPLKMNLYCSKIFHTWTLDAGKYNIIVVGV